MGTSGGHLVRAHDFVDPSYWISKKQVKQDRETITLKVFVKNVSAYLFYIRQGFVVDQEVIDQETNESEYVMTWRKND